VEQNIVSLLFPPFPPFPPLKKVEVKYNLLFHLVRKVEPYIIFINYNFAPLFLKVEKVEKVEKNEIQL
jgi:hypothetical protein